MTYYHFKPKATAWSAEITFLMNNNFDNWIETDLFNFSVSYKETPQCVAGVHFGAFQCHHNISILLTVLCWPVLVTFPLTEQKGNTNKWWTTLESWPFYFSNRTHPAFFHQVGDHDDDLSVLLPNHPPKVFKCRLERTLSGYISSGLVVALKRREVEYIYRHLRSIL